MMSYLENILIMLTFQTWQTLVSALGQTSSKTSIGPQIFIFCFDKRLPLKSQSFHYFVITLHWKLVFCSKISLKWSIKFEFPPKAKHLLNTWQFAWEVFQTIFKQKSHITPFLKNKLNIIFPSDCEDNKRSGDCNTRLESKKNLKERFMMEINLWS